MIKNTFNAEAIAMPKIPTRNTGKRGERIAQDYLIRNGYRIVTTNWRCRHGEIDIVAHYQGTWVFVEVRSRRTNNTEEAFASVNASKQQKLQNLAYAYLHEYQLEQQAWRVDVIGVALNQIPPVIDHVEDALGWQ